METASSDALATISMKQKILYGNKKNFTWMDFKK